MRNNYNFIAPYYDFISRIIFGKAIMQAQTCLLSHIAPNSSLLIAGGGSGWILEEIAKVHPGGLNITYIDNAAKMIALAKKRKCGANKVVFICEPIENYLITQQFDCVLTAFFFDNFKIEKTAAIFETIHHHLKAGGNWLYADFAPTKLAKKYWQKILLKMMYFFFRVVSKIETQELADMSLLFKTSCYREFFLKWHYRHFIRSVVYKKETSTLSYHK
jgi:ubiquinone/menaquinone biosynthesis C-methylase UbiE